VPAHGEPGDETGTEGKRKEQSTKSRAPGGLLHGNRGEPDGGPKCVRDGATNVNLNHGIRRRKRKKRL